MEAGRGKNPLRIQGQVLAAIRILPWLSISLISLGLPAEGIWAIFSVGCVGQWQFSWWNGLCTKSLGGCYSMSSGWVENRHPLEQNLRIQVVAWEGRRHHWLSYPTVLWLHHWDQGSAHNITNTDRTIIYPWDTLDLVVCGFFESLEEYTLDSVAQQQTPKPQF